jgi:hypothetical protein
MTRACATWPWPWPPRLRRIRRLLRWTLGIWLRLLLRLVLIRGLVRMLVPLRSRVATGDGLSRAGRLRRSVPSGDRALKVLSELILQHLACLVDPLLGRGAPKYLAAQRSRITRVRVAAGADARGRRDVMRLGRRRVVWRVDGCSRKTRGLVVLRMSWRRSRRQGRSVPGRHVARLSGKLTLSIVLLLGIRGRRGRGVRWWKIALLGRRRHSARDVRRLSREVVM